MASRGQMTGMRGVYLVAAELARQGFVASPTSRSAWGADILATSHDCRRSFSVQVKTNGTSANFFLLGKHANSISAKSHVYVLVDIRSRKGLEEITYYPIPSTFIAKNAKYQSWNKAFSIRSDRIEQFKNKWKAFGSPEAQGKKILRVNRKVA
jgi:hypothetical protein